MRIGVMGGTFDPIHIGHLLLAEFAYEDFKLDEIWFLPNGNPPHKKTDESKKALAHRIKMIELAISDMPHFKIDLSEAETDVHSYTYSTMQKFNRMYPECEFYFILGADSLFAIEEWRYFKEIFPYNAGTDLLSQRALWRKNRIAQSASFGNLINDYKKASGNETRHTLYRSRFCFKLYKRT